MPGVFPQMCILIGNTMKQCQFIVFPAYCLISFKSNIITSIFFLISFSFLQSYSNKVQFSSFHFLFFSTASCKWTKGTCMTWLMTGWTISICFRLVLFRHQPYPWARPSSFSPLSLSLLLTHTHTNSFFINYSWSQWPETVEEGTWWSLMLLGCWQENSQLGETQWFGTRMFQIYIT